MKPWSRAVRLVSTLILAVAVAAVALAGCGDDTDVASTGSDTPASSSAPRRIISLAPTATEILYAIGAGDAVVAVDDQSNYPPEAPRTDLSGFTPNIEAIVGYEPDLVVLTDDIDDVIARLDDLGIPTLAVPAAKTLDEAYAQWEQIGEATGHLDEAKQLVEETKERIAAALKRVPEFERPPRYYHELDTMLFSVTSSTFIGEVYALAGLENIADPADTTGSGYPQLSAEFIVDEDPDIVFLADTKCCGESAETFAKRPGFGAIAAVRNGAVVALDDDIASRWGPRTADLLEVVVDALQSLPAPARA